MRPTRLAAFITPVILTVFACAAIVLSILFGKAIRGDVLAYSHHFPVPASNNNFDLFLLDLNSSITLNLTRSKNTEFAPAWSPDGRYIAYHTDDTENANVYIINVQTREVLQLTGDPSIEAAPHWSPDGQKIIFQAYTVTGGWDIFLGRRTGPEWSDWGGLRNLTQYDGADTDPRWSPDGERIIFSSRRSADSNARLYTMTPSGSGLIQVSSDTPSADRSPSWSPDGTMLAFTSSRGEGEGVYVMEAAGSDRPQIVFGAVGGMNPAWSPDGTRIAFTSTHDGDLYITDMRDHSITRITRTTGYELAPAWMP